MSVAEVKLESTQVEAPEEGREVEQRSSYGQILRATSIVGGGKVLTILVGLARSKALALLLGPAGIGIMGLLQGVMTTGATLFGLGLGQSGVRQIAAADGDPAKLSTVRKALWRSNLVLGFVGLAVLWVFSEPIARLVFGEAGRAADVAWMGVGLLVSLIATSQMALLQGMRRIGDMVKAGLAGALLGTAVGVAVVWWLGTEGIRWFVLATPLFSVLGSAWYAHKLPRAEAGEDPAQTFWEQWREMASLGTFLMVTALAGSLTALAVRSILARELGVDAAGQFQAAYAISGQYLGLVLGAMAADYYPRLTSAIRDVESRNRTVNDQLEVALLLVAPLVLSIVALAPWMLTLLYNSDFQVAADVLRWQILGDVLKVATWALGFIILAQGDGRVFLISELSVHAVFIAALYLLLPILGLQAAGIASWVQYVYYFPLIWWIARRQYGFRMRVAGWFYLGGLITAVAIVTASARWSEWVAGGVGVVLATGAGGLALRRIHIQTGILDRFFK